MIIINKVLERIETESIPAHLEEDVLDIDWFDTSKTILRKFTRNGREIGLRKDSTPLQENDILYMTDDFYVTVCIKPILCIVFQPETHKNMGVICFEIGNKHIPIFINENAEVIVEYENPLYHLLDRFGYKPKKEIRKLLKTQVLKVNRHKPVGKTKIIIKATLNHESSLNLIANQ